MSISSSSSQSLTLPVTKSKSSLINPSYSSVKKVRNLAILSEKSISSPSFSNQTSGPTPALQSPSSHCFDKLSSSSSPFVKLPLTPCLTKQYSSISSVDNTEPALFTSAKNVSSPILSKQPSSPSGDSRLPPGFYQNVDSQVNKKSSLADVTGSDSDRHDHLTSRHAGGKTRALKSIRTQNSIQRGSLLSDSKRAETALGTNSNSSNMPVLHRVAEGETLWDIAWEHNTSLTALMRLNGIDDGNFVMAETTLVIPPPSPKSPPPSFSGFGNRFQKRLTKSKFARPKERKQESETSQGNNQSLETATNEEHSSLSVSTETAKHLPVFTQYISTAGKVAGALLGAAFVFIVLKQLIKRLISILEARRREFELAQAANQQSMKITKARFGKALKIDRGLREAGQGRPNLRHQVPEPIKMPEAETSTKSISSTLTSEMKREGNGAAIANIERRKEESELSPDEAMAAIKSDYVEIRESFDMESYEAFLRDSGALNRGRFRGGMPRKFRERGGKG